MPATPMTDILGLLQREPGRPRITWYGGGGERIELSGAVLENWVAKTANLLVEELDAGPGVRVLIDLPPHWRTVVWAIAVWRVGACVVLPDDAATGIGSGAGIDVVVTDRPADLAGAAATSVPVVAVSLPALARRFDGALPDRAIDAASAVMTYGDVIGWAPPTDPAATALAGVGPDVTHADLVAWATASAGVPDASRALVTASATTSRGEATADVLRRVLDVLRTSGSVVLVDAATATELALDDARRARLVESERVTAVVGDDRPVG